MDISDLNKCTFPISGLRKKRVPVIVADVWNGDKNNSYVEWEYRGKTFWQQGEVSYDSRTDTLYFYEYGPRGGMYKVVDHI